MGLLLRCALIALSLIAVLPLAKAQDYPTRPITIVVPYTPGGATDILARFLGQKLEQRLGKSVVIENKPGAGTVIGSQLGRESHARRLHAADVDADADGDQRRRCYKHCPTIRPPTLCRWRWSRGAPFVLVVHPSLPVKSMPTSSPTPRNAGQLSYGSGGPGSPHHLYAELLNSMTGIKMTHVPYKGTMPALNDVIAGHVPVMFSDVPPLIGVVAEGKVRPLGVSTKARVAAFPNVPPINEAGVPGFDVSGWFMLVAPARRRSRSSTNYIAS